MHRRDILDVLITGEKAVGAIVNDLRCRRLGVKAPAGAERRGARRCRADGRRRLYRLDPEHLRPLHEWLAKYEQAWNDRLDRLDDYLAEIQQQGEPK